MTFIVKATLADIEAVTKSEFDMWVLLPHPIASLRGPAKRKEFEKVVKDSRYDLSYPIRPWGVVNESAREMSDRGGIESVQIFRIYHSVKENVVYRDGKVATKD